MQLTTFSKALADPTRARLLALLREEELSVGEVVQVLALSQPRISRHLKVLHDSGLVSSRRDGLWNFYRAGREENAARYLSAISFLFCGEEFTADRRRLGEVLAERNREVRTFFDTIAEDWGRLQREIFGGFALNDELLSELPPRTACAVDLGCGNGELLAAMADCCMRVIGVDSSEKMLALAKARLDETASLRIGALEHLPLRDGEADVAIISMVLHHLAAPEKAVEETARILGRSGRLILADFSAHNNEKMRSVYGDRRLGFEPEALGAILDDAGFTIEKRRTFAVNEGLEIFLWTAGKTARPLIA